MNSDWTPPGESADTPEIIGLPVLQAAHSLTECLKPYRRAGTEFSDMAAQLRQTLYTEEIFDEEGMLDAVLVAQARVLDSVFNRVLVNALEKPPLSQARLDLIALVAARGQQPGPVKEDSAPYSDVNQNSVELALRIQGQCRHTIDSFRKTQLGRLRAERQSRELDLREKRAKK